MITPNPGKCSSCGADILWVKTTNGKPMPLDAEGERRVVLGRVTGEAHIMMTYTSHFATCPNADKHRRSKAGDGSR